MRAELLPRRFGEIDAIVLCSLLDVRKGQLAAGIGNAGNLIEACHGVADVASVGERFLAFLWKGKDTVGKVALRRQAAMLFVRFPACSHFGMLPRPAPSQR